MNSKHPHVLICGDKVVVGRNEHDGVTTQKCQQQNHLIKIIWLSSSWMRSIVGGSNVNEIMTFVNDDRNQMSLHLHDFFLWFEVATPMNASEMFLVQLMSLSTVLSSCLCWSFREKTYKLHHKMSYEQFQLHVVIVCVCKHSLLFCFEV